MNIKITYLIFSILISINAQAGGGQLIDCSSDLSKIRIRASYFNKSGEAKMRDSEVKYGDYQADFNGVLKMIESPTGEVYYEATQKDSPLTVRIYSDKTFKLFITSREYLVDEGECHLSTMGPF